MWKIIVGFIAFAALAMFVIVKGGGDLDMSGEKHGTEPAHGASASASAAAPAASDAAPAASAASVAPAASVAK